MPDACTLAVACGAANAMTARAGTVRPDDVAELLEKTTIDPW
jgi:fructose-1-phosphate kinase PfkB-like protein